jgi:hypothetical protein
MYEIYLDITDMGRVGEGGGGYWLDRSGSG